MEDYNLLVIFLTLIDLDSRLVHHFPPSFADYYYTSGYSKKNFNRLVGLIIYEKST